MKHPEHTDDDLGNSMVVMVTVLAISVVMVVGETRGILAANVCGATTTSRYSTKHRCYNDSRSRDHSLVSFSRAGFTRVKPFAKDCEV